jgi:hypothetical protein
VTRELISVTNLKILTQTVAELNSSDGM